MFACFQVHFERNLFVRHSVPAHPAQLFSRDLDPGDSFPRKTLGGRLNVREANSADRSESAEQQNLLLEKRSQLHHWPLLYPEPARRIAGMNQIGVSTHHGAKA